jgi:hypothetical protein
LAISLAQLQLRVEQEEHQVALCKLVGLMLQASMAENYLFHPARAAC